MTPGQWPAETLPSGRATKATPSEADQGADPDPQRPRLAARAAGRRATSIHRGTVATMRAAMPLGIAALRPHHEAVADGQEQHADERVVEPLAAGGPAVRAVDEEGHEPHHQAGHREAERGRGEGRHLVHDDPDGQVGRAPDHPDHEQGEPGQEAGLAIGHAR